MLDVRCPAFNEARMLRLISLLGIVVFLLLAWLLSNNRRLFPWRTVLWGLALQFFFALFILKTPIGARLFAGAQTLIGQLNQSANQGAELVFGPLARRDLMTTDPGPDTEPLLAGPGRTVDRKSSTCLLYTSDAADE